jgi:lipoprotein NlpD
MSLTRIFIYLLTVLILYGCASGFAPVTTIDGDRPGDSAYHLVARGDTLYSIAWRYGLDYRDLARWNRIGSSYLIYPGQRLSLRPGQSKEITQAPVVRKQPIEPRQIQRPKPPAITPPITPKPTVKTAPPESKQVIKPPLAVKVPPPKPTPAPAPPTTRSIGQIQWQWPAAGQIHRSDSLIGREGLAIHGAEGQPVKAAAPGQVVYSGEGLVGYGKLIIIKHNDTFLSAYAHNRRLLVTEGLRVAGGQPIAEMGNSGAKEVKLYFEIRRDGKPVPPLQYLPKQGI